MVDWVILGLVGLLILLFLFKNQSFSSMLSPGPSPEPAPGPAPTPAPGPPTKYTQTMVIPLGGSCPDSTWTPLGKTICAK